MPKTKLQSLVFTALMVFCMVYCMTAYNVAWQIKNAAYYKKPHRTLTFCTAFCRLSETRFIWGEKSFAAAPVSFSAPAGMHLILRRTKCSSQTIAPPDALPRKTAGWCTPEGNHFPPALPRECQACDFAQSCQSFAQWA